MSEPSSSPWTDLLSNLSLRRLRSKASLRSTLSKKKEQPPSIGSRNSSYISYAVYQQTMHPTILKDQDATKKLLDSILDTPGGKRSVSRLARTCKAFREPALDALWRDLDSLIPIIGLFPSNLLKKSRKPGLGLTKTPVAEDWNKILVYGERVRRITYDESANNVAASILSVIHHHQPKRILPNLLHLTWKAETPAGLEHCSLFVNDELEGLVLEINTRLPQLNALFTDVCERTRLTAFSFTSPTNLPDSFIDVLSPQVNLQKLVLVAPGALSSKVGQWAAELPALRNFQLDLTGRSVIAVEGFFEDIRPRSGASTPASVRSRDSGVFSSDELDFSEIRKSSLRLTGDLQSKGSFHHLRQLHLTGEVSNISVFLKHLQCPLRSIDLVIEDPPDQADWQELSAMISERFGKSLQSLRITATGSSRFTDLVRSTSRMEPPMKHLSLAYFTSLPRLIRFEVDLPESNIFHNSDMEHLAHACPNVEILRLCPVARFPTGAPNLTLEGIAPLIEGCHRLHTLAIVVNAKGGKAEVLESRATSSRSLLRLHVGHSWVHDPLQVTILLSHLAPYLETLRWFHEKNRPGFIEANARGWQTVSEYLPLLQNLRLSERAAAIPVPVPSSHLPPVPAIQDAPAAPETAEKSVDATVATMDRAVYASPRVAEAAVQVMPQTTSRMVEARPEMFSVSIDATPSLADVGVYTMVHTSEKSVDATPLTASVGVDALIAIEHADRKGNGLAFESMELSDGESTADNAWGHSYVIWPSVYSLLSSACKAFISFPLYVPMRILHFSLSTLHAHRAGETTQDTETKHHALSEPSSPSFMSQSDVAIPPVGQ